MYQTQASETTKSIDQKSLYLHMSGLDSSATTPKLQKLNTSNSSSSNLSRRSTLDASSIGSSQQTKPLLPVSTNPYLTEFNSNPNNQFIWATQSNQELNQAKTNENDTMTNSIHNSIFMRATGTSAHTSSLTSNMPAEVAIMEIILRLLQLMCENHNHSLQAYLRDQISCVISYDLVGATLQFLNSICGSATNSLGLIGK